MTSIRRTLTIDDPLAAADACHVARSPAEASLADCGTSGYRSDPLLTPKQPRRRFDEESLLALADSIRERGRAATGHRPASEPEGYELIAGERRWRASQIAGLQTLPCTR